MNNDLQLLNKDQSFIRRKLNSIYGLMFTISVNTKIHPFITSILFFFEDIQLIYFFTFDKSVISINEKLREYIGYIALDEIPRSTFILIVYALYSFFIIASILIIIYGTLIKPEKLKENSAIKYLRWISILYNSILFPIFTHSIIRTIILVINTKGDIGSHSSPLLLFSTSIISLICYLFIYSLIFPFVYINPTPFKKTNSLCQKFNFLGLYYHIMIFLMSILVVICQTYIKEIQKYICVILFLIMFGFSFNFMNIQPYYNKYINIIRAGTWSMITGMGFIDILSLLFGKGKTVFGIMFLVIGICSFFLGIILCVKSYNIHIKNIYTRYKEKKEFDKMVYKRDHGIEGSEESDEERSRLSSDNEENQVLYDSDNELDDDSKQRNRKKENNYSDEEDSEGNEYDSDNNSDQILNDKISERITSFSSIREIIKEEVRNEPVVVYKDVNEFELSCRFVWNNETNEAFLLIKDLYEQCILQYTKDPLIYTYYAYYLLYIERKVSKKDRDIIMDLKDNDNDDIEEENEMSEKEINSDVGSDDDNNNNEVDKIGKNKKENSLNEDKLNECNPHYLLSKAMMSKLDIFKSYFVRYLIYEIKEKEKEEKDFYKKEAVEIITNLQHDAIEYHIAVLNLLKKFFTYVKHINDKNAEADFNVDGLLELLHKLKNKALKLYQKIIDKYPDEKSTYQLYSLFMKDVMNSTDRDKYTLNEGDSFMALNSTDPSKSIAYSNTGESADGERDSRKMKIRNNILKSFTEKSKKYSKITFAMFFIVAVLYIICVIFSLNHINNFTSAIPQIQVLGDMDYHLKDTILNIRFYSFAIMTRDLELMNIEKEKIQEGLDFIKVNFMPILKDYSHADVSSTQVVLYNSDISDGDIKSKIQYYNAYELTNNIIVWITNILEPSSEQWIERVDNGENILMNFEFKMFSDNSEGRFDDVICESIDILYDEEITSKKDEISTIYIITVILAVLTLLINFIGITPLYNHKINLQKKTMRLFKYLLHGSTNDLISRFEIGIESITETYDISFDKKKNDISKIDNENSVMRKINKLNGYIVNILLLATILLTTIPVVKKDFSIIKHLDYNLDMGERKDKILDLTSFAFETLIQDPGKAIPGTWESLLYKKVKDLRNIQNKIYLGKLGLSSSTKMRFLDEFMLNQKCRLEDDICENLVDMPEINFTKNIVKLEINSIIDEIASSGLAILRSANIKNYRTEEHMYNEVSDCVDRFVNDAFSNPNFLFIYNMIDHIIAGCLKSEEVLFEHVLESVKSSILLLILMIVVGAVLYFISFIIAYRLMKNTNKILEELVNIIFIVPQSTVNMIPQFKRFMETGSFEDL